MEVGIIYAIIAMLGFGFSNALSPIVVRKIGATRSVFYRNMFTSLIIFLVFLILPFNHEYSLKYIVIAFGISAIGFIPLWTFFKAQKVGKIGIIGPIANSSILFTVVFSMILYGERLSLFQGASILIILVGIILSSINIKDIKSSEIFDLTKGIPFAIITCVLWGLVFALFKIPVNVIGPILTALIIEFGIFLITGAWILASKKSFFIPNLKLILTAFIISVLGVFGIIFFNIAITSSDVSIAVAITFSSPIISVVFGRLYFKEHLRNLQYLAVVLMIVGIIMLSV